MCGRMELDSASSSRKTGPTLERVAVFTFRSYRLSHCDLLLRKGVEDVCLYIFFYKKDFHSRRCYNKCDFCDAPGRTFHPTVKVSGRWDCRLSVTQMGGFHSRHQDTYHLEVLLDFRMVCGHITLPET
ncbi:hypothetical protein JTE90_000695 [Oedothorax gibbosus]|uniref:Uncharacterized protein n=1 Tax=Oedothorax gibbosus TaxID=931172 RepID=A0AAV6TUJ5_9ARAC|nr:hypothetical protein JTE90_000695 [Oedothorax gibbosus]